jgi:ABC-2 type transport system permease protein
MIQKLYKYWYLFGYNYRSNTAYRWSSLSWLFGHLFMIAGTIYVWYISAVNGSTLFNFKEIFTYYIIGGLICINNGVHYNIGNRISSGKLSNIMIVPSSAIMRCVVSDSGWHVFSNLINIILLTCVAIVGREYIFIPNNFSLIIFTFLITIVGFVAQIYINLIFGMLAFWMTDAWGIFDLQGNITNILSGKLIPLSVLPFTGIVSALPFAYFYFLPIQVFMQKYDATQIVQIFFVGLLWIFVLHILIRFVWSSGLKKYEAVGL